MNGLPLMLEAKVQTLIAFIIRILDVVFPLLNTHSIPLLGQTLISPDVVDLGNQKQHDRKDIQADQSTVTTFVQWCVAGLVDIGRYDVTNLYSHVVQSCRD